MHFEAQNWCFLEGLGPENHWFYLWKTTIFTNLSFPELLRFRMDFGIQNRWKIAPKHQKIRRDFRHWFLITFFSFWVSFSSHFGLSGRLLEHFGVAFWHAWSTLGHSWVPVGSFGIPAGCIWDYLGCFFHGFEAKLLAIWHAFGIGHICFFLCFCLPWLDPRNALFLHYTHTRSDLENIFPLWCGGLCAALGIDEKWIQSTKKSDMIFNMDL